jgi:hypothetical protein
MRFNMKNENSGKTSRTYLAIGSGLGLTFGVVIGAVTDNVGIWVALGPIIGAGIGIAVGSILNR